MSKPLDELAGRVISRAPARIVMGAVVAVTDATHVVVDLGDRTVTAWVPPSLAGIAPEGAYVRVSVEADNTHVIVSSDQSPPADPLTMQIVGGKAGAMPAGSMPIIKVDNVSLTVDTSYSGSFTFDTAFPSQCAGLWVMMHSGTSVAPVVNTNALTKTGATLFWAGITSTAVTFVYLAIGW